MIERIIEFSVRNRFFVLLVTAMLVAAGVWATLHVSLDAVPDLSDTQVIIITDYPGQAPPVVEDQVTYPLTTAMLGIPHASLVRGYSMFETSMVYVIFDDGTDLYWARSRVLEYLNFVKNRLPKDVEPKLGPDATSVGWVYQYALYPGYYCADHPQGIWHDAETDRWYGSEAEAPAERRPLLTKVRAFDKPGPSPLDGKPLLSSNQDLAGLRSLQDWYLRYQLVAVPNVAEVASIGGFVKEYQVVVQPQKLLAYNLSIKDISSAIERSNQDVGGSVIESAERELMVRSRGYLHGLKDLAQVPTVGAMKNWSSFGWESELRRERVADADDVQRRRARHHEVVIARWRRRFHGRGPRWRRYVLRRPPGSRCPGRAVERSRHRADRPGSIRRAVSDPRTFDSSVATDRRSPFGNAERSTLPFDDNGNVASSTNAEGTM